MSTPPNSATRVSTRLTQTLGRQLVRLAGWLLFRLIRVRVLQQTPIEPDGPPVVYALQVRQFSNLLVLDRETRHGDLPLALAPLQATGVQENSAFFFLTRNGQPSPLEPNPYRYSARLERLVAASRADPSLDLRIVPVSVFWGRAPDFSQSFIKTLFADSWVTPGFFRQAIRILVHGRHTQMQFGAPLSLRELVHNQGDPAQAMRRVARHLRAHFRQQREVAIGPNLSHRATLVNEIIASERVQAAMRMPAASTPANTAQAERLARRFAVEIAADWSYSVIRVFEGLLQRLWTRLYDGINLHGMEHLRRAAEQGGVVLVPCHRSHIDYLLLSYAIFDAGMQPPYVAAGANLNLPLIGPLLRRGGAFFMRRSFSGEPLYAAVFAEYLHAMLQRGYPVEYFIEGGRSRTGLMLPPKSGLLRMTVDSFLRSRATEAGRRLSFVPVWIGYERLVEGDSYLAELGGAPKRKESLLGALQSVRTLRQHFGKVHVNIGPALELGAFLDRAWPERPASLPEGGDVPDPELDRQQRQVVSRLAHEITGQINDAVVINPVNLVAIAMLSAPRQAMDADRLVELIDVLNQVLERVPYSRRQRLCAGSGAEALAHAERHGLLERIVHPLGDMVQIPPQRAAALGYFRNNVMHVFALPGLLASLVARFERIETERLRSLVRRLFPFFRAGYQIGWTEAQLAYQIETLLDALAEAGLLHRHGEGLFAEVHAPAGYSHAAASLQALAHTMRAPLERLVMALALLQHCSGQADMQALEDLAVLTAQRISYLHDTGSPEYADRASLRSLLAALGEGGYLHDLGGVVRADNDLASLVQDTECLLPLEVRRGIRQISQLESADIAAAEQRLARA